MRTKSFMLMLVSLLMSVLTCHADDNTLKLKLVDPVTLEETQEEISLTDQTKITFDSENVNIYVSSSQSKSYSYDQIAKMFFAEIAARYGDVNNDGVVDISDVNAIIDVICGHISYYSDGADVSGDNEVDIADVNEVISIICGNIQ